MEHTPVGAPRNCLAGINGSLIWIKAIGGDNLHCPNHLIPPVGGASPGVTAVGDQRVKTFRTLITTASCGSFNETVS
jgi:hypothetical protein